MASNESYSPTSPASSINLEEISYLNQPSELSQPSQRSYSTQLSQSTNLNITNGLFKDSKYNKSDFKLNDEKIYIFEKKLFNRQLLPIDYTTDRKVVVECTSCSYKKNR